MFNKNVEQKKENKATLWLLLKGFSMFKLFNIAFNFVQQIPKVYTRHKTTKILRFYQGAEL